MNLTSTPRHWHLPRLHPVAFAVWRRNALVWRRLFVSSLVFHFGEPLLYLIGIGYGLGRFIDGMEGMDEISYLSFFASGLVASSAMMSSSYEATYSAYTRMVPQKTYDGIIATPVEVDDIVAGEMLWCATKGCMAGASLLIVATLIGAFAGLEALLCIPILLLIGLAFSGLALAITATAPSYDYFSYYMTLFITPMFILCGVFYPVSSMPAFVQGLIQILPLTHAVALVRPIVTGATVENPILHVAVLIAFAFVGFYIAVVLIRRRFIL